MRIGLQPKSNFLFLFFYNYKKRFAFFHYLPITVISLFFLFSFKYSIQMTGLKLLQVRLHFVKYLAPFNIGPQCVYLSFTSPPKLPTVSYS